MVKYRSVYNGYCELGDDEILILFQVHWGTLSVSDDVMSQHSSDDLPEGNDSTQHQKLKVNNIQTISLSMIQCSMK